MYEQGRMDFMIDAGMPPDMCNMIQDICQGGFDQHMASNPDASPWMHLMLLVQQLTCMV